MVCWKCWQDGFFVSSAARGQTTCLGPDDIYVSPDDIRQHSLRTGDTIEGLILKGAGLYADVLLPLTEVTKDQLESPKRARHKVAF